MGAYAEKSPKKGRAPCSLQQEARQIPKEDFADLWLGEAESGQDLLAFLAQHEVDKLGTVSGVLPAGWTFLDNSGSTISRTIEGNYTPLEVIQACVDTYGVVFRFDVKNKIVRAYTLTDFQPIGSFASRELNLTEKIDELMQTALDTTETIIIGQKEADSF